LSALPAVTDRHAPLVRAWERCFDDIAGVEVKQQDYFAADASALVSPANSFGIMDGGLDVAIRDVLGFGVQDAVQERIRTRWHGELPVGAAEVVPTGHSRWPFLVVAPTMRVPEAVGRTLNAYLAFRAILLAARRETRIASLVCCGLGTGIGGMSEARCALQMRMAYRQLEGPARIPSFAAIHATHDALKRS